MDKEIRKYWKMSQAKVEAELRNAGLNPQRLIDRIKEMVHRGSDHLEKLLEAMISIFERLAPDCRIPGFKAV